MTQFSLTSPAFKNMGSIPSEYTCKGEDKSPELNWEGEPKETKSFALTIFDPDAPTGDFTHWVIYNIPITMHQLPSNFPKDPLLKNGIMQGLTHFGYPGYGGPCPPIPRKHCYVFTIYALDSMLALKPGITREELQRAMQGHVLASAVLKGTFSQV